MNPNQEQNKIITKRKKGQRRLKLISLAVALAVIFAALYLNGESIVTGTN